MENLSQYRKQICRYFSFIATLIYFPRLPVVRVSKVCLFNPKFFVLPPLDEESVCRLPSRCGWQCWLQEHLLRHHTRRGEGGVNVCGDKTENEEMNVFLSLLYSPRLFFVLLLFVFLPPFHPFHHLCYFQALTLSISPKTCLTETELGGWRGSWPQCLSSGDMGLFSIKWTSFLYLSHTLSFSLFLTHYPWPPLFHYIQACMKVAAFYAAVWRVEMKASIALGWNTSLDRCGR